MIAYDGARDGPYRNVVRVDVKLMNPIVEGKTAKLQSEKDFFPVVAFHIQKEDSASLKKAREGVVLVLLRVCKTRVRTINSHATTSAGCGAYQARGAHSYGPRGHA